MNFAWKWTVSYKDFADGWVVAYRGQDVFRAITVMTEHQDKGFATKMVSARVIA